MGSALTLRGARVVTVGKDCHLTLTSFTDQVLGLNANLVGSRDPAPRPSGLTISHSVIRCPTRREPVIEEKLSSIEEVRAVLVLV